MAEENQTIMCGGKPRKPWRLFAAIAGRTLLNTFFVFMGIFLTISFVFVMIIGWFTPLYRLYLDSIMSDPVALFVVLIAMHPAAYHAVKYLIERCAMPKEIAVRCVIFAFCFSIILNVYFVAGDKPNRELFLISPTIFTGGAFASAAIAVYYARLLLFKRYSPAAAAIA